MVMHVWMCFGRLVQRAAGASCRFLVDVLGYRRRALQEVMQHWQQQLVFGAAVGI